MKSVKQELDTSAETEIGTTEHGCLFDPGGLLLAGVVGAGGLLLLLRHNSILGLSCAALATTGLIVSHRHFDPASKGDSSQSE
jgi:hypothetical protein